MKRFLAFAALLISQQIVKAHSLPATDSALHTRGIYSQKIARDTVLTSRVSIYANSIFKLRLDSIRKDVPLDYNEFVQNYIDLYTRHKEEMGHVMGLSKYYFPIYEKIFREAGIPAEIKYLSIVESKLDPNAVSRVGATGPWQFMATTAKMYGLNMTEYVDDRRDPIQASYAAAAYLKDAYQEFGDWLLAIASYNCGKSNVEHAIVKAGAMDFWSIRQYLPLETRNYVPAYIAVSYVMNYGGKHNIAADSWSFSAHTDTLLVDKFISLSNVARALNVQLSDLTLLNPSYKKQIVNGTTAMPRRLVIPYVENRNFAALYEALNNPGAPIAARPPVAVPVVVRAIVLENIDAPAAKSAAAKSPDYHTVKEGETLENIAANYGLDIREIKAWNHLQSNKTIVGKKLKLNPFAKESRG